ncbi:hypothetical protein HDG40_006195 [Paraburkholderia sp. JPY158]|uniref:Uncharacterized protein n=1 Tax=Paraburkholderia atlantica TaxID=2654982 RepID=A0A7W8QDI6_PARAM|nr:hypothetical protein [Paraburkholderia atlantica]MBB5428009.1 hypothetical protein [Paraburkholderia atlantica]
MTRRRAIERFEREDPSLHSPTSRSNCYLDAKVQLTEQGLHGKTLFDQPAPVALRVNVNMTDAPLTRKTDERLVWPEPDIDVAAAVLVTLTDGYGLKAKAGKCADRKTRRVLVTLDLKDKNCRR